MTTPQQAAQARIAARRDRIKGTNHLQRMYRDHYTIDYDRTPIVILRDPTKWTNGPSGWWRTKSGAPL